MTRRLAVIAAVLAFNFSAAHAQDDFGIGVIIAEPTGLSAKLWFNEHEAVDMAAAWSFARHDSFQLHADYLYHRYDIFENADTTVGRPALYFGLGARLKLGDDEARGDDEDDRLGIRVPGGVTYRFAKAPFDVFAELVPVLDLAPETELELNGAVGGRFYFGRVDQLRP